MKNRYSIGLLIVVVIATLLVPGCRGQETTGKIDTLRLVGTIGPLSIPLAYMVDNDVLKDIADNVTLESWATPQQLQAIIAGGQADFVSLPTNAAATFYNRGIELKLLDCSIWNILFLVSTDPHISSAADLIGKRVVVPFQAAVPDAIFRYVLMSQGIDPDVDLDIYYAPDPVQASQLLLSGQEHYALLSEPSATSVLTRAESSGITMYRNLDMNRVWQAASQGQSQSAIAGTIALGAIAEDEAVVRVFMEEYRKAVAWMINNPVEAGELGARVLAAQGFTAGVLTDSLVNIEWRFIAASEGKDDIEAFFRALMEINSNYTGGQLPDDAFYYGS